MKKVLVFLILGLLIVSMASFAIAKNDKVKEDKNTVSASDDSDDSEDEPEDDDKKEKEDKKEDVEVEPKRIEVEKTTTYEDGKKVSKIKNKYVTENGTRLEVQTRIETRSEDGKNVTFFKYQKENSSELEIQTELQLREENEEDENKIKIRMENGTEIDLKILPDQAAERARERLETKSNLSIKLQEKAHKNIPRVVYNIQANKTGRFLGIFKFAMEVEGEIDAETGEFIGVSKPWWAFLVKEFDEEPEEPIVCSNETLLCDDNITYVSRNVSLDCEFDACPVVTVIPEDNETNVEDNATIIGNETNSTE